MAFGRIVVRIADECLSGFKEQGGAHQHPSHIHSTPILRGTYIYAFTNIIAGKGLSINWRALSRRPFLTRKAAKCPRRRCSSSKYNVGLLGPEEKSTQVDIGRHRQNSSRYELMRALMGK